MYKYLIALCLSLFALALWAQQQGLPNDPPQLPANLYTTPSFIGGGSPGGLSGQVQYNNAGAFGGSLNFQLTSAANGTVLIGGGAAGGGANSPSLTVDGNTGAGSLVVGQAGGSSATALTIGGASGAIVLQATNANPAYLLMATGTGYEAPGVVSTGTNSVAGCSLTVAVGGASAGKFASGTSGTCTVTITLPTAPNGWTCDAHDLTTAADANNVVQTAFTAASATIAGTTVSGDVITWKCQGW